MPYLVLLLQVVSIKIQTILVRMTPQTPNDFDYSTTQQVQLNVQYEVPEGYQVLFDVYFENPFEIDEEGQVVKRTDVVPKVTRMTDGNGKYAGLEVIPGYLDGDIYIYSSYIGVPTLYKQL